jgi:hypothetical protein
MKSNDAFGQTPLAAKYADRAKHHYPQRHARRLRNTKVVTDDRRSSIAGPLAVVEKLGAGFEAEGNINVRPNAMIGSPRWPG